LLAAAFLHGGDWPRFRGPNGSGVGESAGLPAEVGPDQNVVWKAPLPPGHSSPVIGSERIFLTAFEGDKLWTICLDRASGREQWRREAPRTRREKLDKRNSPASPSPVADGRAVYVFFPDYGLLSYDFTGKQRWGTPLGPFHNIYGMGASPVLADDKVILIADQSRESFAAAFRQKDGREVWRTPRPEALSGHATPILWRVTDGATQILAPGSFRMDAYDARDGKVLWWVSGLPSEMKSGAVLNGDTVYVSGFNTPENDPGKIVAVPPFEAVLKQHDANQDGRISADEAPDQRTKTYFPWIDLNGDGAMDAVEWRKHVLAPAAENGLLAFRAGGTGDVTSTNLKWKYQRAVPQLPTTLLYRDTLYMINDSGILTTLDPVTGAVKKQARLRGAADSYYASPVAGDGKVYFASRSGKVTVLKAGGEQEVLATSELDDEIYATPAIADGRLYLRTRNALYCFGVRQP
jgi:outer membrane protein assembly factor BamB